MRAPKNAATASKLNDVASMGESFALTARAVPDALEDELARVVPETCAALTACLVPVDAAAVVPAPAAAAVVLAAVVDAG